MEMQHGLSCKSISSQSHTDDTQELTWWKNSFRVGGALDVPEAMMKIKEHSHPRPRETVSAQKFDFWPMNTQHTDHLCLGNRE